MKLHRIAVLGLVALSTMASDCEGTKETGDIDTAEVTFYDGETIIQEVVVNCDATTGWTYYAKTDGWTSDAELTLQQVAVTTPWDELHHLDSIDYDPDGYWDEVEKVLPIVTAYGDQIDDTNTLFQCAEYTYPDWSTSTLSFMLKVWDAEDNFDDCAVWGRDVSIFAGEGPASADCYNFNPSK